MRFANIRELKLETKKVIALSRKNGPVVIMRRAQPIALLRVIDEDDIDLNIGILWGKLRRAAERAGYGPKDVNKLIKKMRAKK